VLLLLLLLLLFLEILITLWELELSLVASFFVGSGIWREEVTTVELPVEEIEGNAIGKGGNDVLEEVDRASNCG
jgi:hypothetical protein